MTHPASIVVIRFEPNHPAFAGHFPGRPIIPGVQLLDRVQRLVEAQHGLVLGGLQMAKFLSPAGPADALELEYRVADSRVLFEIRCGARRIASGQFIVAEPAPA